MNEVGNIVCMPCPIVALTSIKSLQSSNSFKYFTVNEVLIAFSLYGGKLLVSAGPLHLGIIGGLTYI